MEIIVEGYKIETKDIVSIKVAGGRTHGFIIQLIGNSRIFITIPKNHHMHPNEFILINDRYRKLREKVEAKWNEDKTDIPIFSL